MRLGGVGVVLGEAGLGIGFENAEVAHALGFAALIVILSEGGLTTSWPEIRPSIRTGALLATVGVAVTVVAMTLMAHYILGLEWNLAVLLAAVTAPTDAAAVFYVLRRVPLPRRITGPLEAESGLNDAPTVLLVGMATAWSLGELPEGGVPVIALTIVAELVGGVLLGAMIGYLGGLLLPRLALPASGRESVARILTVVDLPAPLGPSSAKTVPAAMSSDRPSSARTGGVLRPAA